MPHIEESIAKYGSDIKVVLHMSKIMQKYAQNAFNTRSSN